MSETKVVLLAQPLPCGSYFEDGLCNRPAWLAWLAPMEAQPGRWILTPVCQQCADEVNALLHSKKEEQLP